MEYTPELAAPFIGKRVLVSLRDIGGGGEEAFSAFCGVIESAEVGGLVVRVEGKGDDKYWVMPPDLDALVPAEAEAYEIEGYDQPVQDIDYVACFAGADSIEDLPDVTHEAIILGLAFPTSGEPGLGVEFFGIVAAVLSLGALIPLALIINGLMFALKDRTRA